MHTETAFALTILAFCYAVVSALVKRWYIAPALILQMTPVDAVCVLGRRGLP